MTVLQRYTETARRASATVIDAYSTSFGLATRLLPSTMRGDIRSVYALVRVADEIVDGCGAESGLDTAACGAVLDGLEHDVERAIATGFSADLVVHAFADTARRVGITIAHTRPFFSAMRRDLVRVAFVEERELRAYVHGSAEVVGLMCVRCLSDGERRSSADARTIDEGARALGSAFQVVNFLRDLGTDADQLDRAYLPGIDPARPDDAAVALALDRIDAELRLARRAIELLPARARPAVVAAHDLFAELARRIRAVPAARLSARRVRVSGPRKAAIAMRAVLVTRLGTTRDRRRGTR